MREALLQKLLQSKKYGRICPDTAARVLDDCLQKYKKPKDVEKAVREKLHGIMGAFMTEKEAESCRKLISGELTDAALTTLLEAHASTRERLPLDRTDETYRRIFEFTGTPSRILDLACGLNPIYLGWRGHAALGLDISGAAVGLINDFGQAGAPVCARCADLLCENAIPGERFPLALALKLLPVLESQKKGAAMNVLEQINAPYIAVSFPTRTLSGRNVGMEAHYSEWMEAHLPAKFSVIGRFVHERELFYILKESAPCQSSSSSQPPSET